VSINLKEGNDLRKEKRFVREGEDDSREEEEEEERFVREEMIQ